jgi:hypothetical protein
VVINLQALLNRRFALQKAAVPRCEFLPSQSSCLSRPLVS